MCPSVHTWYLTWVGWFALQGNVTDGLPKNCQYRDTNITKCLFPEFFANEIETPLLPVQSIYDPLQFSDPGIDAQTHGDWVVATMNTTVYSQPKNGVFLHSCSRHCGAELVSIGGVDAVKAAEAFVTGGQQVYVDHQDYKCDTCCNDPVYPPTN